LSFVLPQNLPEIGVAVPILAAFTGHKRVPLWAVATNNANPKLRFYEAEIELKVIKTHRRVWADVERVDAKLMGKTNLLTFDFVGTPWNFSVNVVLPPHLKETLRFLASKNLTMTPRALDILNS
jgi:hypothetical protein